MSSYASTATPPPTPASPRSTQTGRAARTGAPVRRPPSSPPAAAPLCASIPPAVAALGGLLADRGIKGDSATGVGGKQGALTGSIFSEVPALTVEMVVLTDAHDYRFIRTRAGQQRMAQALLAGVEALAHVPPEVKKRQNRVQ